VGKITEHFMMKLKYIFSYLCILSCCFAHAQTGGKATGTFPIKSSDVQHQRITLTLTAAEVDPKSVRVITQPTTPWQNLVFRYVGKDSEEIKTIAIKQPQIQIVKDGVVVAETDGGCSLWKKITNGQTNNIGLVLLFSDYDKAKLAEKTLRGD
jgi:hypothetical protein